MCFWVTYNYIMTYNENVCHYIIQRSYRNCYTSCLVHCVKIFCPFRPAYGTAIGQSWLPLIKLSDYNSPERMLLASLCPACWTYCAQAHPFPLSPLTRSLCYAKQHYSTAVLQNHGFVISCQISLIYFCVAACSCCCTVHLVNSIFSVIGKAII